MTTDKKKRLGRPPAEHPRTHRHEVRLTDEEEQILSSLRAVHGSHCDIIAKALRLLHAQTPSPS